MNFLRITNSARTSAVRHSSLSKIVGFLILTSASVGTFGPSHAGAGPSPQIPVANDKVFMISDSVGLSARDTIPKAFPGRQVTIVGYPGIFTEQLADIVRAQPQSVFGDVAIVATGYVYATFDPPRFDREVDSMIDALHAKGVKRIVWVTLREVKPQYITASAWQGIQPYYFYFPDVNDKLRAAVTRHPDLTLADWSAIADQPGLTYDAIHLTQTGQNLYSSMLADVVDNAATELATGSTTAVTVAGINGVPADAKAVAVNLTVTTPRREGYLTAFPCGTPVPATSNLNFKSDQTVAVSAIVNVGTNGQICLYNNTETEAIVDVQGYLPANSSYQTIAPTRLVDTREPAGSPIHPAGAVLAVPVTGLKGIPADAAAVAINLTVTDNTVAGYATAFPCDQPPANPIALVNYITHTATPNFSIVKPAANGTICFNTSSPAHLVVDAFGYFPAGSAISVTSPVRLADTRPSGVQLPPLQELVIPVIGGSGQPKNATAAVLNITAADPTGIGFVVAYPCGTSSPSSTLNVVPTRNTSNGAIVAPGTNGSVCIKSNTSVHLLVDVTAWILDGYTGLTPWRAFDSRLAH
jgi:hypothetical protein